MNINSIRPLTWSPGFWQILQGMQASSLPKNERKDIIDISPEALRLSREGITPISQISKGGSATDGYNNRGQKQSARK